MRNGERLARAGKLFLMGSQRENRGGAGGPEDVGAPCPARGDSESPRNGGAAADAPELDHRGIRMPARTRVGGIIIPQ